MEYSEQSLYISDLATADGASYVIEDSQFKNCQLRGPAVVRLAHTGGSGGGVTIPGQNPESVVLVAEEGRATLPVGVVLIRNCRFDDCSFEGISFLAPADEADELRNSLMRNVPQA